MKDFILELLIIMMLFLTFFIAASNSSNINQLIKTNQDSCQWVVDQGMTAPPHCDPYL